MGWFGHVGVVVADAASYLVAAALIWLITTLPSPEQAANTPGCLGGSGK